MEIKELNEKEVARTSKLVRGGNWGPNPGPVSGGPPAVVLVCFGHQPCPIPSDWYEEILAKHPLIQNARVTDEHVLRAIPTAWCLEEFGGFLTLIQSFVQGKRYIGRRINPYLFKQSIQWLHLSGSDIGLLTAVYFVEQYERFKSLGMDESAEIMKEVLLALSVGKLRWK